jgi:MFS family permease
VVIAGLSLGYAEVYRGSADRSIQRMAADSVRVSFQSGRLRTLFGAFIFLYAGRMLVYAYLPVFVAHLYRGANPASAIGYVLGSAGVLSLLLSPAFGAAADRLGHWRVLMIGAALETLLWIVPYWTRMLVPFAALVCLTSAVSAAVFSISFNVLSSSAPSSIRGRVMAFAYMPVNVGFSLGPMIGSQLVKIDLFYIFPTACILTAFGLVGLGLARRQPMLADPTGSNPVAT